MRDGLQHASSKIGSARGSVLVIVLVTLMFATFALVAFVEKASDDLIVEAREASAIRLRKEGYSALEVTLGVLEDFRQVNGALHSPAEGWADPLGFAGWEPQNGRTVDVVFEDESGKLSLPHVESVTFVNLFKGWGMAQSDAERLADSLLGWMRKDHVSSSARQPDYEQGPIPYLPPQRSLRTYAELAAIDYARQVFYDEKGQPNELWHRFVNAISLLDFKQTNLNGLNGSLLNDLGVIDISQQRQFDDYRNGTGAQARRGPGFFENPSDAAGILGAQTLSGFGTQISALRINLTVKEGRSSFRLSVVVAPVSGGAKLVAEAPSPSDPTSSQNAPTTAASAPAATGSDAQAAAKKLNYPFTLLEIRENAEISAVLASPTKA